MSLMRPRSWSCVWPQLCVLALSVITPNIVRADAGWFDAGDRSLRIDLQLLNDARVISLPVDTWPLPRAAVSYAIEHARTSEPLDVAAVEALARVRMRLGAARQILIEGWASGGEPGLFRDFDSSARGRAEVGARGQMSTDRISATLAIQAVDDPVDGQEFRLDGSELTVQWGNWLISAHTLDRFWGPSHESSLILSNNARPMPTFMIERAEARAFETKWLSWLGPWRMSFGISQMEDHREDIDSPKFMAWRIVTMPFRKMELGFSRTAEFCGKELECNLNVLGNLLAGNDNVGIDATRENEPGNQMAGFDLRWSSPIGNGPYSVYAQYIGEDESSYLPAKFLSQLGAEVWATFHNGSLMQWFAEYSSTTCSANTSRGPYYNCAYNQGRFNAEGYRYRGRVIGHSADNDAEMYSLGVTFTTANGDLWSGTLRNAELNHDGLDDRNQPSADGDQRNTVSAIPAKFNALELGWRGHVLGDRLAVDLGFESVESKTGGRDNGVYGFVRWTHDFAP